MLLSKQKSKWLKNKTTYLDNKGFTLVELLISVVILSIVSLSFFSFFIQANQYSVKNNEKLVAINIARATIEKMQEFQEITGSGSYDYNTCLSFYQTSLSVAERDALCTRHYKSTVEINSVPTTFHVMIIVDTVQTENGQAIGLYPSVVDVYTIDPTRPLVSLGSDIRR